MNVPKKPLFDDNFAKQLARDVREGGNAALQGKFLFGPVKRRRTCAQCKKKKLIHHAGRGRIAAYCSRACKQRSYRLRSAWLARARSSNPELKLLRQDMRQILETDRLKRVAIEVFKEMGVFEFLERLGFQQPAPQPSQLKLVKTPPNPRPA